MVNDHSHNHTTIPVIPVPECCVDDIIQILYAVRVFQRTIYSDDIIKNLIESLTIMKSTQYEKKKTRKKRTAK